MTMTAGEQRVLQLVTTGGIDSYRLALDISFDPKRVRILELAPAAGIAVLDHQLDDAEGWLSLDVMRAGAPDDLSEQQGQPLVIGGLLVEALEQGSVPLILTSQGAVDGVGEIVPVATGDGAIYVQEKEAASTGVRLSPTTRTVAETSVTETVVPITMEEAARIKE
jgi:hypothetical protein